MEKEVLSLFLKFFSPVILGISLITAGAFFFKPHEQSNQAPTSIKVPTVSGTIDPLGTIVLVDGYSFTPAMIEIKNGETVIFRNIDSKPRWPASDIHPSHGIYPEFDPEMPILAGKSWSFTFHRTGEWKFHDHLYPELIGKIIVRGAEQSSSKNTKNNASENKKLALPAWDFSKNNLQELKNVNMIGAAKNKIFLEELIKKYGPKAIMDDLLSDSGNGAMIDCHQEAHAVGRISYALYGSSVFSVGNSLCHSGYYHGAIETFLAEKGTTDIAKNVALVCAYFDTSFEKFECLHGMGHGILAYENYDLPKTLTVCGNLGSIYMASSCYGGAFMENIVTAQGFSATAAHKTKWLNKDPHFPCNKLDREHNIQYQCYQMQTSWMLTLSEYNFDTIIPECLKAPNDMVSVCFKSLGRDAAGHTLRNAQKIKEICGKVPDMSDYYNQCIIGAINVIVDFWGNAVGGYGSELCKILPDKGKRQCFQVLSSRLVDIFNTHEERQSVCNTFEHEYQNLCSAL